MLFPSGELATIHDEYGSFFRRCELVPATNASCLAIETLEGKSITVSVLTSGWFLTETIDKRYDTFEALMMTISPGFNASFASSLTAKLEALTQ